MVEFGNQVALLLLRPFPLGDVNADADDPARASIAAVGSETARLDPTHLAVGPNDTILHAIFAPRRTERFAAELLHAPYVVGVHARQAFPACYLASPRTEAVNCRVAPRDLHHLRVGVIRVAANESRLSRQHTLNVAFRQSTLRSLALADVDRHVHDTNDRAGLVA